MTHLGMNVILILILIACTSCAIDWPKTNSQIKKDPKIEQQVQKILAQMTIEQKVAQMIQAEIKFIQPRELEQYPLGSILNGGGSYPRNNKNASVADWVNLADEFYTHSVKKHHIPIIWGTDAVHGHNNLIGATIFPHNIGLGAANNPELIEKITRITAKEVSVTGQDWVFAPTVAVVRDDRWGRSYEGYSEDPEIVKKYAFVAVKGLQGDLNVGQVIATAKHFIGDGGTENGVDQGNNSLSEKELIAIHAQGYKAAIDAGVQTIMASFNSWQGKKIHGIKYLLTEVLKKKMAFDGFVIGDWNGHGQVKGCRNDSCPQAINAGVDMIMVPQDWKKFYNNTLEQVKNGEIALSRINDAVSRILRVKLRYGIFDRPRPKLRKYALRKKLLGSEEHKKIARQAVRESLVLLKNNDAILPLQRNAKILVMGSGATSIAKSCGGWTVTWQGTEVDNKDYPNSQTIFETIKSLAPNAFYSQSLDSPKLAQAEVAVVIFGENPYAEGQGDLKDLRYNSRYPNDLKLLKKLQAKNIPVVSIFLTGRPMWINPELNNSDAFVVAWLPGTEAEGITDVIFKKKSGEINYDFKGKLSFSWPKYANQVVNRGEEGALFEYGYGLSYTNKRSLNNSNMETISEDPFLLYLSKKQVEFKIYSGRPMNSFQLDNPSSHPKISKLDRLLQEDSLQIHFKNNSALIFTANESHHLERFAEGELVFYLKKEVNLKKLDITIDKINISLKDELLNLSTGEWHQLSIPLKKFIANGLKLDSVSKIIFKANDDSVMGLSEIKILD